MKGGSEMKVVDNIKRVTIKEAKEIIKEQVTMIKDMIEAKVSEDIIKSVNHSIYLLSSPGIGKTSITEQVAKELNVPYVCIHPAQRDPNAVLGIPFPDQERTHTTYLRPKDMFPDEVMTKPFGIYTIDEFSSCNQDLQAVLYTLILHGELDGYKINPGWVRVMTGNLITDSAVVYQMSSAAIGRVTMLKVVPDLENFKEYIFNKYKNNSAKTVVSYLIKNPDRLHTLPEENYDGSPYNSPRKWEKIIINMEFMKNPKHIETVIAGDIGVDNANHFVEYCKIINKLPEVDELIKNPEKHKEALENRELFSAIIVRISLALIHEQIKMKDFLKSKIVDMLPKEVLLMILKEIKARKVDLLVEKETLNEIDKIRKKFPELFEK